MASESGAKKRVWLYVLIVLVAAGGAGVNWMLQYEGGTTWTEAPPETHGVWTTDNPRYAGRAIEVGPQTVTLQLGEAGSRPGRLVIAREVFHDDARVLRLEYETESGPDQLEMVVEAPGRMYLVNQPEMKWTSDGSTVVAPPPVIVPVEEPGGFEPTGLSPALLGGAVVLLLVVGLGTLWLFGRGGDAAPASRGPAPRIIRGVWTTPDPRYEGQSIRIAGGYGFSQFGPGDIRVGGHIDSVDQWREDGERVVSMTYSTTEGTQHELDMIIDKAGHMRIRGGPRSVWVKRDD